MLQGSAGFLRSLRRECVYVFSHVQLFVTPWTVAHQAPLSMEFPRPEYWSELPFPTPGDLPNPGIEPQSLVSAALVCRFFTTASPGKLIEEGCLCILGCLCIGCVCVCVLVYNISAHLGPSCAHVTGNVFVLLGHAGALEAGVHLGWGHCVAEWGCVLHNAERLHSKHTRGLEGVTCIMECSMCLWGKLGDAVCCGMSHNQGTRLIHWGAWS